MKKMLFIAIAAFTLMACGGGETATSNADQVAAEAQQQALEKAKQDSIEKAKQDSIEAAKQDSIAKAEAAEAAMVKKKMRRGYYTVTQTCPMKANADEGSKTLRTLKRGAVVSLTKVSGVWCKVIEGQDGPQGWTHYKNLKYYMPFEEYD